MVTDIVTAWVEDSLENTEVLMKDSTEITDIGNQIMFHSREHNEEAPILEIAYIVPVSVEGRAVNTLQVITPYVVALVIVVDVIGFLSKKRFL